MAEEQSAKRHHGETSDKSNNLVEVHVPGEMREYTKTLTGVELHGKEMLEIVCTSEPDKADEMISRLWRKVGGSHRRIVGVGVHYTSEDEPPQMVAVLQLCVEELCLVYHIAAATKCIESDKEKLRMSGLEINRKKYIDIQRLWRVPYTGKEYDSLTDVAASITHPFYKGMKKNINMQEDHKLWGISPLPDNIIEYVGVDAYAAYKSWSMIDNITNGWETAKVREGDNYYDRTFWGSRYIKALPSFCFLLCLRFILLFQILSLLLLG
ncbi:uncharacterized protein [Aegilops tauschii subsp. strangulata]|uniref:uncharacterized protein n=1 Tax=Aegilops tauschii subsp. strangulata TaxID=200361 RepID=UPI003CC84AF1